MNRTTAAALVTTAVIGVTAGAVTAVVRGDDPGSGKTPTAADTPGTTDPSPDEPAPSDPRKRLLWADDDAIHDGDRRVALAGPLERAPDRLVRAEGGYLVAYDHAPGTYYDQKLYFVAAADGAVQVLSDRVRSWDLAPAGDRVVVDALRNLQVIGFDGVVQHTTAPVADEKTVLWNGDTVTVHGLDPEVGYRIWAWQPGKGKAELTDRVGFDRAWSGRSGQQVVGSVGYEGSSYAEENPCVGTGPNAGEDSDVTWFTCDWRLNGPALNPVSPGARRLLVVHSQTDGFGPGAFGIIDLAKGPAAGVPTVSAPEDWMLDAAWVDDDHFAMSGANSDEVGATGGWIHLSDTEGTTTEIVRTDKGRIVLGEQF